MVDEQTNTTETQPAEPVPTEPAPAPKPRVLSDADRAQLEIVQLRAANLQLQEQALTQAKIAAQRSGLQLAAHIMAEYDYEPSRDEIDIATGGIHARRGRT